MGHVAATVTAPVAQRSDQSISASKSAAIDEAIDEAELELELFISLNGSTDPAVATLSNKPLGLAYENVRVYAKVVAAVVA